MWMFGSVREAKSELKANKTQFEEMFGSVAPCNFYSAFWVQFPWCFLGVGCEFILFPRHVGKFSLPPHIYSDSSYSLRVSRARTRTKKRRLSFNRLHCLFMSDHLYKHTHLNRRSSQTSVLILMLCISL